MILEPTITPIIPDTFEYQTYSNSDENLIVQSELDTVFSSSTDYIEYYIYDQNKDLIYPSQTVPLLEYDVRKGDVLLNPSSNLESLGFDIGVYNISYSFYRKRAASSITEKYFISDISSDRTEIRLDSNVIENSNIISSVNDFVQYRETSTYFVDFYLNFGQNQTIIANNIKLETEEGVDPTVLIKLYEPLPLEFNNKSELWVVELLSSPQAYKVDFPFEPTIEDDFTYIAGPNYNLNIIGETASPGEQFSYNTLINSDVTSSINQIQSLLNEKEININIDYEKFANFINFSSAKTRLENFFYKVDLIQSSSNQLSTFLNQITTDTTTTLAYSSSAASLTGAIDTIIKNFDGYEYFLYFNSGSSTSYPKSNTEPPFILYPTSNSEVQTWITSSLALAIDYDDNNRDWLYNSIPEYLRDDPANRNYELFVDMVGQYYDNVWTYTKDITNKFDADNRLDYGISKDLVSDAIKDFAVKLYSNNFNTDDLFTAFLGLTPSGSAFPFPNITGSLPTPSGYEYVDTKISASNDIVPLDDVNKSVYKRIYHNIPYLLKTKGTIAGLRALITSYGIPDTILRISEFGGKDRNESQDYDLKQDVFNYAFDTGVSATNFVSSSLQANNKFPVQNGNNKARTIQLRFKSPTIPLPVNNIANSNIRYSQSLFSTDDSGGNLVLEYTGSGLISGSYSGSIPDPYDTYGTLKWIPAEGDNPDLSASVYLPFFNGDWWSVQMNVNGSTPTASLYVANEIDGKIGFNESSSVGGFDDSYYYDATIGFLNKDTNVVFTDGTVYTPFSGSFQELRYYVQEISQSYFLDYVVNPYSSEGNSTHPTDIVGSSTIFSNDLPNQQFFRADLGTQLNTSSRTSIHPRVTGSAVQITQSFATNSNFYINTPNFITNVEDIFQDQVPVGIKNRITDKIQTEKIILAEAPYGFTNPTSSLPVISSENNDTQTISPMESMQVTSFTSQSYTPNVNYLEVAFSPSNQINDDINAQLGYFNLGEFIGDPRFASSSLHTYPDLDRLRNSYFEKYMDSYDVVDFVRLIKFFDNSLFKMIKDFTPARTSLSSGVVVKQHILERNRQRPAQATSSLHDYEGLVVNLPKDYSSGSTDFPQYSTEGSSIYKFSGGTGGSFERFNGIQTYGIPLRGQLLGRDGGGFNTGTDLKPYIKSSTFLDPTTTNLQYSNILAPIIKGNGYYPVYDGFNYSLGNISVDIEIKAGNLFNLSVFATTLNTVPLSAGNRVIIQASDINPSYSGEIIVELVEQIITPAPDWNATVPYNRFGVTQSWQDGNDGSVLNPTNFNQSSSQFISGSYLGPRKFPKDNQSEFYDGIFSGSMIIVATQSLNPGCDPYLNANDTPVVYKPIFFPLDFQFDGVVNEGSFNNQSNVPPEGYAWISSKQTDQGQVGIQQVQAIKLSQNDVSGVEVINYLDDFENLKVLFTLPSGKLPYGATATEYFITGRTVYADHIILQVSQTKGNNFYQVISDGFSTSIYYPITSSEDGGSMQWSLDTKTDYTTSLSISESIDDLQQGVFLNPNTLSQEQNFYYWNNFSGTLAQDALGFFNSGSTNFTTFRIFFQNTKYENGAYTIPYTPNIPWYLKFDVKYSASLNTNATGIVENEGIYHQGNKYEGTATLTSQTFLLNANPTRGFYVKSDVSGYTSAAAAAASADLTSGDNIIYYSNASGFFPVSPDTPVLYSDPTLSTLATSLQSGRYYKFSNLDVTGTGQDYFVVRVSTNNALQPIGSLQTGNRNPISGKTATIVLLNIDSGFYRPAPKSTTGLGTVLFNGNNFNTQIPGNSGSVTPVTDIAPFAGHPKIKVPTTNSMFITDLDLQLGGVPPTLGGGGGGSFIPFSGSGANTNNTDFDLQFFSIVTYTPEFLNQTAIPALGIPNMGETYDGSIRIRWTGATDSVARSLEDSGVTNFASWSHVDFTVSCIIQSQGVSADFDVQLVEERFYPSGDGGPLFPSPRTISILHTFSSDSNGKAELSNEVIFCNGMAGQIQPPSGDAYNSRLYFLIKNNEGSTFDYSFQLSSMRALLYYNKTSGGALGLYPATSVPQLFAEGNYTTPSDGFQNGTTNESLSSATSDFYNECVVNAYLKRTGSQGDFIITSSIFDPATGLGGFSGSIYSGSTVTFTDTPIRAFKDVNFSTDTTSTYANPGDIYYIEYEFKDLKVGQINGSTLTGQQFDFKTSDGSLTNSPKVEITASGEGGSANFGITSSILLRRSNLIPEPENTGEEMLSLEFLRTNTYSSTGTATVTSKYPGLFNANDIHRFSVQVEKEGPGTGLVIQEFSASIYPSQSLFSPLTTPFVPAFSNFRRPQNTNFIVPTYYEGAIPFNLALDCQPMLNNFILQRPSEYLMDVDYNNESGPIIPVNQEQILDNKAVKAAVPDSNYTTLRSINPRYDGVKSTSAKLNVWSVGDFGTYGKNPTVELRDAYFGYFNDLDDPYPNINGLTRVNLSYLIDEQGNALPPSLEPITIDTFKAVFPNTTVGKLAVKDINSKYQSLGSPSPISRTMEYVTPICYSQNSGENYSPTIPLSGSGYISRYDDDNANLITFAQFSAVGTASIDQNTPLQSVDYFLDPSEAITQPSVFPSLPSTGYALPYVAGTGVGDVKAGAASYPSDDNVPINTSPWGVSAGDDLNNEQIISMQTSVVTTFVSETNRTREELKIHLKMHYGNITEPGTLSTEPFNLEYIDCKVYTQTGDVFLLKNVDQYGWFQYGNLESNQNLGPRYNSNLDRWTTSRVKVPKEGLIVYAEWEMFETLFDLGLMRERHPKNGSGVIALEWIFSANSGRQSIKAGNELNWSISGRFKNSRGGDYVQGMFFPIAYNGAYTPTKIQGIGVQDHLLAGANIASAPFWTFSGSTGIDYSIIEMSSSNFNEAYGTGFYQGDLPYEPGTSQYFPGNVEPSTTAFDTIENPIEFQENDEIRFANNENFTYRVLEVFAPQENISSSAAGTFGKVKLRLDRPVDKSIQKDFFLVRRKVVNPNSLYLETPFPYGTLSSGSVGQAILSTGSFALQGGYLTGSSPEADSKGLYTGSLSILELQTTPGILFPDFPTEYLTKSASVIVNDLISKGVIES